MPRKKSRTGGKRRGAIAASSGRLVRGGAILVREGLLLLALGATLIGFLSPWLVIETAPLAEALLDLPPSEALPGWRLPAYAREVETTWVVELVRLFSEDHPDTGRVWWVWASPLAALVGYFVLRARRLPGALATAALQGGLALFMTAKLLEGLDSYSGESLTPRFGYGLLLSALGHGLLAILALECLDRRSGD